VHAVREVGRRAGRQRDGQIGLAASTWPVKVSSLLWASRCRAWASSAARPTKLVRGRGRRPGGPGSAAMLVVLRAAQMCHSLGVRTRAIKTHARQIPEPRT
jgi:hypothetical protein